MLLIGPVKVSCGLFYHHGLYDGAGFVVHNSKKYGRVIRESLDTFSEGKKVICSNIQSANPVLANECAMKLIGRPYYLFSDNCEHFVQLCNQNIVESPQLQKYLSGAAGLALAIGSKNKGLQASGIAIAAATLLTPPDRSPKNNLLIVLAGLIGVGLILN
ncbi:MAG: lecithin retinol acyltransferase family protein [Flavobacteriaceae bacterium]|nr:lecithin retinol acyltransferase family protein [Flavobacteriaceae bacterium]